MTSDRLPNLDGQLLHSTNGRKYRVHQPRWWQILRRLWFWRKGRRTGNAGAITVTLKDGSRAIYNVYEVFDGAPD